MSLLKTPLQLSAIEPPNGITFQLACIRRKEF
jgi:hypothetical protein